MTGRTHGAIGANAVWLAAMAGMVDERAVVLVFAGIIGALLPDVDANQSVIHRSLKGVTKIFAFFTKHRGFFHSFLAWLILLVVGVWLLGAIYPLLPLGLAFGYASHLVLDGLTVGGVRYLWPFGRPIRIMPKWFRFRTGGIVDRLLFVLGICGALYFLIEYGEDLLVL